ncbi:MAG: type II secretion system protein GspE, partial [Bacillota bacterium]|nr:type II secretion system protein GspE [Bacillota bacterium]
MTKTPKKRLGDILVEFNVITEAQLQEALKTQKQNGLRLGQALIKLGFVTEQSMNEVLEFQLGIPQIALHKYRIDPKVVELITGDLAKRHLILPFEKKGNKLHLAMADPLNLMAIDDVQSHTGLEVEPAIATEREIKQNIS